MGLGLGQSSGSHSTPVGQGQFNHRARQLWPRVKALCRPWTEVLGTTRASLYLLDTKPLSVVGCQRDQGRSDFAATADYRVRASRNLKYWGYKLVLLCTPAGVPAAYELMPASTDARIAGEQSRTGCGGPASSARRASSGPTGSRAAGRHGAWRS